MIISIYKSAKLELLKWDLQLATIKNKRDIKMSLIDLSFTGLKPPVISIGNGTIEDLYNLTQSQSLTTSEMALLNGINQVIEKKGISYCSAEEVAVHINKQVPAIRYTLKSLTEKGVLIEKACTLNKGAARRASLFVLNLTDEAKGALNQDADQKPLLTIESERGFYNYSVDNSYGVVDDLICGVLFCLLDYSHYQGKEYKNKVVGGQVMLPGEDLPTSVNVVSEGNERIALVRDLRYYLAVLKVCEQQMEQRALAHEQGHIEAEDLKNVMFNVYEYDLLHASGRGKGKQERSDMSKAMWRLNGTKYYLNNADRTMIEKYNLSERKTKISHFDIVDYAKGDGGKVVYVLSLDQPMVDRLYDYVKDGRQVFQQTDPRLMTENVTLKFALILKLNQLNPGQSAVYSWSTLREQLCPKMPLNKFKEKITKYLESSATSYTDDKNVVRTAFEWTPNKRNMQSCVSELYDFSITYTVDSGFMVYRKASALNIKQKQEKGRQRALTF